MKTVQRQAVPVTGQMMKTSTPSPKVDKKWPTIGATTGEEQGQTLEICTVDLFIWALRNWLLV